MMMTNLFSSFDPSTSSMMSLNWVSALIFLMFSINKFWVFASPLKFYSNFVMKILHNEFKIIISSNKYFSVILMSLFIFIMVNNFMGLFPYIFTSTSHMSMSMPIAIPLWLGMMLFGWIKYNKDMFAHLVPQSTPGVLMPFMVIIESISNVIRPVTLSIRLSANMIAGHLLMTLLGNQMAASSEMLIPLVLVVELALVSLEMAVSLIQAYVFSVLMTLYISEVSTH